MKTPLLILCALTATLAAIKLDKTPPPKAARAVAILHTAIYDAVNGIAQTHERYLVSGKPAGAASPEAAVSVAAHLVLVRLFPAQQAALDAAHNKAPASAPALLPQWPKLVCFVMTSGAQFRPPRMPALTSAEYAVDFNLTKQLGAKDSPARTAEQTAIAQFWADGPGTVTPPGLAAQRKLPLAENARLFALLNIALADAAILCRDCKYDCNFWRPITAIQNADSDKNPATEKDPAWTPLLETPPFPEYTSGHSTFSSAAATVLAAFFGSDEIAFSTTEEAVGNREAGGRASPDAMPGFSRTFHSFSEAAAEAGISRIFGGIHFMSANTQGLASGARRGTYVADNFLKARPSTAVIERPKPETVTDPPARRIVATGGQNAAKGNAP